MGLHQFSRDYCFLKGIIPGSYTCFLLFFEEPDLGAPLKIYFPMAAGLTEFRKLPSSHVHMFQNKKQQPWKSSSSGIVISNDFRVCLFLLVFFVFDSIVPGEKCEKTSFSYRVRRECENVGIPKLNIIVNIMHLLRACNSI